MKQRLHISTFGAMVLGCFLSFYAINSQATPCSITFTDTSVLISCGNSVRVGGFVYDSSGTYIDTLTGSHGCDSIVTLHLTVTDSINRTQNLCSGDSFYFYGSWLSTSGTYDTVIAGAHGCDSVLSLQLVVHNINTTIVAQSMCSGDSFTFNSTVLYATGNYYDTLTGAYGCDSIVELQLTVDTISQTVLNQTICQGDSYNFNDSLLTIAGTYIDTLFSSAGCDSIVTLNLSVLPNTQPYVTEQDTVLTSSAGGAYQWYFNDSIIAGDTMASIVPYAGGNYSVQVMNANGCQSFSQEYFFNFAGIAGVDKGFNLRLYPNPNSGIFTVEFSDNTVKYVSITDVFGQTVVSQDKVAQKGDFDLGALPGGVYILKVSDSRNTHQVFKQILVQH